MSIGDLNTPIQFLRLRFGRDRDGFPTESEYKNAIVAALYKGTKRYVHSEESDAKNAETAG